MKNPTTSNRTSDRELTVTRTFDGPPHIVFQAWTEADLFRQWWLPKSFGLTLHSCEMDARDGGSYKLVISAPGSPPMTFFGRYTEYAPPTRLQWTNDENGAEGPVTTVSFEAQGEQTRVVMRDLYPSKAALDEAIASGSTSGNGETFDQLEAFVTAAA